MENYLDSSFVITNNTIITYSGQHQVLKIPPRFAEVEVLRIGDGSFMESSQLQCVTLPPRIREIGKRAFEDCTALSSVFLPGSITEVAEGAFGACKNLSDVVIYGMELSADEYYSFISSSNKCSDGVYVLRRIPDIELVQKIISAINVAKPAYYVPDSISGLFSMPENSEPKGIFSLDKNIPVIGFSVPSVPMSENKAFCEYIRYMKNEYYDSKTEEKNDCNVRIEKTPEMKRSIIFTFDDTKTKEDHGMFYITATLKIGYFFWQSAQPVICEGKWYYIYRRCYLNSDPDMCYVRRDIAVYKSGGLVSDREEAQKVYAKYKLLNIL